MWGFWEAAEPGTRKVEERRLIVEGVGYRRTEVGVQTIWGFGVGEIMYLYEKWECFRISFSLGRGDSHNWKVFGSHTKGFNQASRTCASEIVCPFGNSPWGSFIVWNRSMTATADPWQHNLVKELERRKIFKEEVCCRRMERLRSSLLVRSDAWLVEVIIFVWLWAVDQEIKEEKSKLRRIVMRINWGSRVMVD